MCGRGDEIGLIFCKKICAAASALCGDTPVSPSLLVKHAPSRVLIHSLRSLKQKKRCLHRFFCFNGRGDMIRTRDILDPNQALYQAELRPDVCVIYTLKFFFCKHFLSIRHKMAQLSAFHSKITNFANLKINHTPLMKNFALYNRIEYIEFCIE